MITEVEWNQLKAKEAYGMYANLFVRLDKLESGIRGIADNFEMQAKQLNMKLDR